MLLPNECSFSPCASCGSSCCSRMFTFFAATLLFVWYTTFLLAKEQTHAMNWKMRVRVYIAYASSHLCRIISWLLILIPTPVFLYHLSSPSYYYCLLSCLARNPFASFDDVYSSSPFPDLTPQLLLVVILYFLSLVYLIYLFLLQHI